MPSASVQKSADISPCTMPVSYTHLTFLLKERTTEGHDSAGKQQKDDYINDMHTDRAFKVSIPDKKGVPPTPCVSSRVPEH